MTSRQFYRVRKEHDTDFEALAEKYRKKAAKSQDLERPICAIAALVLFILSVIFFLQGPDSWGPGMLLIMPTCGIGLGKWISGRVCKYYQKKYDDALAERKPPISPSYKKPAVDFLITKFSSGLVWADTKKCRYHVTFRNGADGNIPKIIHNEIDEKHVYSKKGENAWYVIQTLKAPSVRTSPLQNSVYMPYHLSMDFHSPEVFLALPDGKNYDGYASISLTEMVEYANAYTQQKGLDESLVFCHIFRLGGELYKDFILCARKEDYSWRLEAILPTKQLEILPSDYFNARFFFDSFRVDE